MTELTLSRPRPLPTDRIGGALRELFTSPRYLLIRRTALAIFLVTAAFHYTLSTLLRTLNNETPLAYLGLVPVIALLLAAARIRPEATEPAIHDRQVDYILAVPLLIGSMLFDIFMPVRMSTLFWLYRLDLVAFPMFVAGVIILLFGTRALWRLKIPVLFLVMAWPLPYTTFLVNWLTAFTNSTLWGLNQLLHFVKVATPEPAQGLGTYLVGKGASGFSVSVASACSGVNGFVGYALVAVAFLTVVGGSAVRKGLWLALGLAGTWSSNVLRIFLILVVGRHWGETVAIDVLHPVAGLILFNLIVLGMVLIMGKFGLSMRFSGDETTYRQLTEHVRKAVPKVRLAAGVVVAFTLLGYFANSTLRQYDLVVSSLGAPRLVSFSDSPTSPQGWNVAKTNIYTWAKPYFGDDSTWYRYEFTWNGSKSPLQSDSPIISDVINTSDVSTFSTYGIEACYRFHGYTLHSIETVDLGGGVTGNVLAYYNTSTKSDWTTLYFHWPVKTSTGKIRYERITLMLLNTAKATFKGPAPSASGVRALGLTLQNAIAGKSSSDQVNAHLSETKNFLIEFAHSLIARQAAASSAKATTLAVGAPVAH